MTPDQDQALDFLETQIPALAKSAVTAAYWNALASGQSVLETDDGAIYEVFPDGTRRLVKKIAPPVPVAYGQKFAIPAVP